MKEESFLVFIFKVKFKAQRPKRFHLFENKEKQMKRAV